MSPFWQFFAFSFSTICVYDCGFNHIGLSCLVSDDFCGFKSRLTNVLKLVNWLHYNWNGGNELTRRDDQRPNQNRTDVKCEQGLRHWVRKVPLREKGSTNLIIMLRFRTLTWEVAKRVSVEIGSRIANQSIFWSSVRAKDAWRNTMKYTEVKSVYISEQRCVTVEMILD